VTAPRVAPTADAVHVSDALGAARGAGVGSQGRGSGPWRHRRHRSPEHKGLIPRRGKRRHLIFFFCNFIYFFFFLDAKAEKNKAWDFGAFWEFLFPAGEATVAPCLSRRARWV